MQIDLANYQMTLEIAQGVNLKLIKIPAGKFIMGSKEKNNGYPAHEVRLLKNYYIGEFFVYFLLSM